MALLKLNAGAERSMNAMLAAMAESNVEGEPSPEGEVEAEVEQQYQQARGQQHQHQHQEEETQQAAQQAAQPGAEVEQAAGKSAATERPVMLMQCGHPRSDGESWDCWECHQAEQRIGAKGEPSPEVTVQHPPRPPWQPSIVRRYALYTPELFTKTYGCPAYHTYAASKMTVTVDDKAYHTYTASKMTVDDKVYSEYIALEVPKDWKTGPGVIIIEHWDKILDQAFKDPRALGQDPHPSENDTPEGKVEDEKNFTPPWCAICLGGPDLDHRACGR